MDATSFVTASPSSLQAFKTATLLKTLSINALITGEVGVGKKSLARYILPEAIVIDASNFEKLLSLLQSVKEIIITDFDNLPNKNRVLNLIKSNSIRVIATAKSSVNDICLDEFFSLKFDIPPLRQRMEDVESLIDMFLNEAYIQFGTKFTIDMKNFKPNLSQNSKSLKRQVIITSLLQDVKDVELMNLVQNYLQSRIGSHNDYKNFLYLYEVPLIKAGLNKFKSQLQLADRLGLNRNTLRKKITDNKDYL